MFNKAIIFAALLMFTTSLLFGSTTNGVEPSNSISVKGLANGNEIIWHGAINADVTLYIVQRSEDGVHYQPVAMIPKTIVNENYSFVDQKAKNSLTFYRILNVDANGDAYFSQVARTQTAKQ